MTFQLGSTDLFWEQLLEFVEEGRVIPVVGRELLRLQVDGRETTLHALLAERLAEHLDVPEEVAAGARDPLNSVVCRCLEQGRDVEDVYPAIRAIMHTLEALPIPNPLLQLASIPKFKLFVSKTFDTMLQQAIDQVRFAGRAETRSLAFSPGVVDDLAGGIEDLERPTVYHLFGRLSAMPEYAVTEEDTLEFVHALQSEKHRPSILFDELGRHHLLIIGSSFSDWLARFFIRIGKGGPRLRMARGKTDFVADDVARRDSDLVLFLEHFSPRTKVFETGGAVAFVTELHERWTAAHPGVGEEGSGRPDSPSASDMTPGAVFLSYASEDLPAAQAIRDSLDGAGVDVWFDKRSLEPGDAFADKIRRDIERCSLFVPIVSKHCLTPRPRFFRIEWDHARQMAVMYPPQRRFIVPVAIDDTSPNDTAIPDSFRRLHWVRLARGRPDPEFVTKIRDYYRDYWKTEGGGR